MDFGLGLVLSFTDNATAGINNAVNSLSQLTSVAEGASTSLNQMASLSALSVVADRLGSSFLSAGQTILSTLGQVVSKINDVGSTVFYAENKLGKLYEGTGKTGKDVMGEIATYAQQSIFEYEDLIDVVAMLKANGIEAFDDIASSTGNSNQKLMDYAADLAAFNPQMKNTYGTGIKAAMGALNEYIAEGNAMSLKRGASLDITGLLGEDKGATMEERSRQVADLMEQLNLVGMTASMAGTPMQRLSNVQDMLFTTMSRIADSGVYEKYTGIIAKLTDFVFGLGEAEEGQISILDRLIPVIGDTITSLMTPIEKFIDKVLELAQGLVELLANNPALLKMGTILVAMGGVFAVVIGVVLKVTSAFSGLSLMMLSMGKTFGSIGGLIKTGMLKIMSTLIPLTATIGLMYLAWKSDFAGIRTNLLYFVNNVITAFSIAKKAVNGSVADMITTLAELRKKDDFFSNLAIGIMKIWIVARALSEAWNTFTLSEDTYLKAKELGVLPLIEAILDLKYRFDFFKQGFIDGWKEIGENVKNAISGFLDAIDGTILEKLVDNLTTFLEKLASGDTEAWYEFGRSFADFSAKALLLWGVLKVVDNIVGKVLLLTTVFSGLKKVVSAINLGGIFSKLAPNIATALSSLKGVFAKGLQIALGSPIPDVATNMQLLFTTIKGSLTTFLGTLTAPVLAGVALVLGSVIAYAVTNFEEFKAKVTGVLDNIKDTASEVWESFKTGVTNMIDTVKDSFSPVVDAFNILRDKVTEAGNTIKGSAVFQSIVEILSYLGEAVMDTVIPAINSIVDFIGTFLQNVWNLFVTVFNAIVSTVGSLLTNLMNIIGGILDIIVGIFTMDFGRVLEGVTTIFASIGLFISNVLSNILNIVMTVLGNIINIFTTILASIFNTVKGTFQSMLSVIQAVMSGILDNLQNIWNFITGFISGVLTAISSDLGAKFDGMRDKVSSVFDRIKEIVSTAVDKLKSLMDFKWELPKLKMPHFSISGGFSLKPLQVPSIGVDWYAKGGVFDAPSVIGVGEQGKEAVMPLENNLGWISQLASMITERLNPIRPVNSANNHNVNNNGDTSNKYLTSTTNNQNVEGDTDNSITISEGAIQIYAQNSSEEEAIRMAKVIMEYIKRQKELDKMLQYS